MIKQLGYLQQQKNRQDTPEEVVNDQKVPTNPQYLELVDKWTVPDSYVTNIKFEKTNEMDIAVMKNRWLQTKIVITMFTRTLSILDQRNPTMIKIVLLAFNYTKMKTLILIWILQNPNN